jgi:hypothetical protein
MSERTFWRWRARSEADGEEGLVGRQRGRRSGRAVPEASAAEVERIYRDRFSAFAAKHFHERLVRCHGFSRNFASTKTCL